jgi:hypothetical protein
MDETSPPKAEQSRSSGRSRDWLWKVVVPIVVAVLGALFVGALTPVGQGLRELLFPTKAAVSGSVVVGGQPAADAHLTLDGEGAGSADDRGSFLLVGVGAGTHRLHLQAVGAQPRDFQFVVVRETAKLDVGVIELRPLVDLGYFRKLTPQQFSPVMDYDFTLWIIGDTEVVNRIQSVSYTLPAPLSSGPAVTRRSPRRSFCYRQAGELPFQELVAVGNAFATATAIVDLGDGQSFQVSALAANLRPPACPAKQGTQEGQPTPPLPPPPPPTPATTTPPPLTVVVPNVQCLSIDDAQAQLEAAGLEMQVAGEDFSDECEEGTVAQQDPAGGVGVSPGSTVRVVESLGPKP